MTQAIRSADEEGMGELHEDRRSRERAQTDDAWRGEELSPAELRAAELGFRQLLRRKRFPAAFLDEHASDLLAQARLEYARAISGGEEIRSPAGWIIHCAWRRTQNLLEHERRVPRPDSIEDEATLEGPEPTPEEETLLADRHRKLREAVGALPAAERKLVALTYFEGMSVREASRALGWANRTGDRRHHSALAQLRELLGVSDAEALQIEIGVAAWALIAAEHHQGPRLPSAIQHPLESAAQGLTELAGRAQELVRRLLAGGAAEGGMGAAGARSVEVGGGSILAAATAGVCGAAAVTCLATGVFVPGLAGTSPGDPGGAERGEQKVVLGPAGQTQPRGTETEGLLSPAPSAELRRRKPDRGASRADAGPPESAQRAARKPVSIPMAPASEVADEFDPIPAERDSSELTPEQTQSQSRGASAPPPAATGRQVETEFGL